LSKRYVEPQANVIRTDSLPWLRRQFSTNTHYFKDIRVHRNSVMYRGAALNLHKYRLRASSCPDIYRNSMTTLAKENEQVFYKSFLLKRTRDLWKMCERCVSRFSFSFLLAEVVCRTHGLVKGHVGFFHVFRISFPVDVIVHDIAIHMVHRTVLLSGGASD